MDFVGCPAYSTFNPFTRDCECPRGEEYNTEVFKCEKADNYADDTKPSDVEDVGEENEETGSASVIHSSAIMCFMISFVLFIAHWI